VACPSARENDFAHSALGHLAAMHQPQCTFRIFRDGQIALLSHLDRIYSTLPPVATDVLRGCVEAYGDPFDRRAASDHLPVLARIATSPVSDKPLSPWVPPRVFDLPDFYDVLHERCGVMCYAGFSAGRVQEIPRQL